jgi:hypothetical protein
MLGTGVYPSGQGQAGDMVPTPSAPGAAVPATPPNNAPLTPAAPAAPGYNIIVHFLFFQEKVGQLTAAQFASLTDALAMTGVSAIQPDGGLTIKFQNQSTNVATSFSLIAVLQAIFASVSAL